MFALSKSQIVITITNREDQFFMLVWLG